MIWIKNFNTWFCHYVPTLQYSHRRWKHLPAQIRNSQYDWDHVHSLSYKNTAWLELLRGYSRNNQHMLCIVWLYNATRWHSMLEVHPISNMPENSTLEKASMDALAINVIEHDYEVFYDTNILQEGRLKINHVVVSAKIKTLICLLYIALGHLYHESVDWNGWTNLSLHVIVFGILCHCHYHGHHHHHILYHPKIFTKDCTI